jgi:hypothetical protein
VAVKVWRAWRVVGSVREEEGAVVVVVRKFQRLREA